MPVHKKVTKAVKKAVKKFKGKIGDLLSLVDQVWKLIPSKTRRNIAKIVVDEGRSRAIDFTCNVIQVETGFPASVCEIVADKIVDLAIEKYN